MLNADAVPDDKADIKSATEDAGRPAAVIARGTCDGIVVARRFAKTVVKTLDIIR